VVASLISPAMKSRKRSCRPGHFSGQHSCALIHQ
jgi:hypothetical protein